MNEVCSDNRFELIEKYKNKLIEATNIEDDADDMKAIDSILFRFWQMGWLDKLELMPCEEAISKYAILKDLKECQEASESNYEFGEVEGLRKAIESVNEMPLVYPKIKTGHWIPISERLPEESDYVSCLPFYDGTVIWITDKGIMGFGWYYNSTNNWADTNDFWSDKYGEVTAWMPLPEPYKPRESEEEYVRK